MQLSLLNEWLRSILLSIGLSTLFDTIFANSYLQESAKLLILGSIIETGRRACQWLIERFKFRELLLLLSLDKVKTAPKYNVRTAEYFLSARFDEGDPAYEWLVLFLVRINNSVLKLFPILNQHSLDRRKCMDEIA